MRRRVTLAALTAVFTVFCLALSAAGEHRAGPPVRFSKVQYDSPGSDTGSNKSLNKEWTKVSNQSNKAKKLTGWTIRDTSGHVYKFKKFTLKPGKTVTLHTGSGNDSKSDRYWRSDAYIWNNTGDKATLKNKGGNKVDVCKWGDGDGTEPC